MNTIKLFLYSIGLVALILTTSSCMPYEPLLYPIPQEPSIGTDMCSQENHPARRTNHADVGQVDICDGTYPEYVKVMTNWGTKPQWLNDTSFVFVSNQVGDVYRMDIETGEIDHLTGHFPHAGFTRIHVLINSDLLLLGPSSGPQPPIEPLVEYSENYYAGDLFVLPYPYNTTPVALNQNAWEGIAVSNSTMRIAWSTVSVPFWVSNDDGTTDLFGTLINYIIEPGDLWTGVIQYDSEGVPYIEDKRLVLAKGSVGSVFLEPQDFGAYDATLLASAYGPMENLGDMLEISMIDGSYSRLRPQWENHYEEWEGIHPNKAQTFVEINNENFLFENWDYVDLYIYNFETQDFLLFASPQEGPRSLQLAPHEPVFSPNGEMALATTGGIGAVPGYGVGIVLFGMIPAEQP